jgi:hypothetical protein
MNLWRSLAKPVRVAVIIVAVLAVFILLNELLDAARYEPRVAGPERLATALHWFKRLWLPATVPVGILLAGVFGAYQLWLSWRRPAISLPEMGEDAQQLSQWLLLALCGACLGVAPFVAEAAGSTPSSAYYHVAVLGLGLCSSALVAADFLAIALTDRLNEGGLVGKVGTVSLWGLHVAGPLIFPLAAYLVAHHVIRRRFAETASPAEGA